MCEFLGDKIPSVFQIWSQHYCYATQTKPGRPSSMDHSAHILMKDISYSEWLENEYEEDYYENEDGICVEYQRTGPKEEVDCVFISDEDSCGNYVIGTLLQSLYPAVKTVILDRYRGFDDQILKSQDLAIENFIGVSTQGADNPFTYIRSLPKLKHALFESTDCYQENYVVKNEYRKRRAFVDDFTDCLQVAKDLQQVMFFVCSENPHEVKAYPAPPGWTYRLLKFDGPQYYYWIVYEKVKEKLIQS
jgi:hypothetical protein